MILSERIKTVSPSMTMAITAKAAELRALGEDVIGLGAGEPDFNTPDHIGEAAKKAIVDGHTKYTPADGLVSVKEAIIRKFARDSQLDYKLDQIIVNSGAKQGIYNICQVLLNKSDEAIIPAPYWVSYPDVVSLAEGVPVIVTCSSEQNFKLTAEDLEKYITPKTKLLFLNSPSNPTGQVYSRSELLAIAEVLRKYPYVYIISDDIYEHIIFNQIEFINLVNIAPDLKDRVIIVNGVSKAYAMTGWRIGYCAGSKEIISASKKLQSQSTSNPCSIAQLATIAALDGPQDFVHSMVKIFAERNEKISSQLNQLTGLSVKPSSGAFYLFVDAKGLMSAKNLTSDLDLAAQLLEKQKVAVVPGTPFGMNGFIRISFATSFIMLEEAVKRINNYI